MAQTSTTENLNIEALEKKLFDHVMRKRWEKVAKTYKKHPSAHTITITSSGETALHLAISDPEYKNKVKHVEELVRHIEDPLVVLRLETEKGNTPLHLAAGTSQGGKLCEPLIKSVGGQKDKKALELLRVRCKKGETPLFKAVHYGRLGSFFYLNSIIIEYYGENFSNFKRNDGQSILDDRIIRNILVREDGQNILHDAIIREHFGLAFYIIQLYTGLVNLVDNQGESPLHALARKPAAFESVSGLHYWQWDYLIYKCTPVEELKRLESHGKSDEGKKTIHTGVGKECTNIDIKSVEGSNIPREIADQFKRSPETCRIWYGFDIFGCGPKAFYNIYKKKQKHTWAKQVLKELLDSAIMYGKNTTSQQILDVSESSGEELSSSTSESSSVVLSSSSVLGAGNVESSKIAKYGIVDMVKRIIDKFLVAIYDEIINGKNVMLVAVEKDESSKQKDTALLIAAKHGIVEMVQGIVNKFPVAIYDEDINGNNVLLLALKKRHLLLYKHLIDTYRPDKTIIYQKQDKNGNTALHLAATYDKEDPRARWPVPGAALQMQLEVKWYEFVESTMPSRKFLRNNKDGQTPWDIFSTTHKDLTKDGMQWLQDMARSCSVVAALIVTISYASSVTVPGGIDGNTGKATLRNNSTFNIFAIASLCALCFSVTALITFLSIFISRYHEKDFSINLPRKILIGLTWLFGSIAALLVNFCAGRFLVFEEKIKYGAFPIYAVMLIPLCIFLVATFPLYFDVLRAICFSRWFLSFD